MIKDEITSLKIERGKEPIVDKQSSKKVLVLSVIVVVVCVVAGLVLFGSGGGNVQEVEVITVSKGGIGVGAQLLNAGGYIVAKREAALSAKATGELVYLGVEGGDSIRNGQLLAKIKDNDIRAQLSREQANLQKAQSDYKRNKGLFDNGVISAAEFDALETALKLADANVTLLQAQLDATRVYAPFDGIVIKKYVDVGNMIVPGKDIISVIDTSEWYVEVDIGEDDISRIEMGQPSEVTTKVYPDRTFKGEVVAKMSKTSANRGGGVVTVRVKLVDVGQNNLQLSNVAARITFLRSTVSNNVSVQAVHIPQSAVFDRDGESKVFVVKEDVAYKKMVSLGKISGNMVEITSGLSNGDKVIVSSIEKVSDGCKVKIKQSK